MNLAMLKERIVPIKEVKPVGKTFMVDGVVCHIMGMLLQKDGVLKLLALEYDDEYRERAEQAEIESITDGCGRPATNRISQKRDGSLELALPLSNVDTICLGGWEFASRQRESSVCSPYQWEGMMLCTRFLLSGWEPTGIDTQNMDYIYLSSFTLDGEYSHIPDIETILPMRFSTHRLVSERRIAEHPVTLTVGRDYDEKTYFTDPKTQERHWIQINRVSLYDLWAEIEALFADPRLKEHFSDEELAQRKAEQERNLLAHCPKGMRWLAVDYECEDDNMSVQFYSRYWLEKEPECKNSASMIFTRPEQPTGKLGKKLKTALVQEAVSPDAKEIEAELFDFFVPVKNKVIEITE